MKKYWDSNWVNPFMKWGSVLIIKKILSSLFSTIFNSFSFLKYAICIVFSILNFKKKFVKKIFYYANYTSYFTMPSAKKWQVNCITHETVHAKAKIVGSCYEKVHESKRTKNSCYIWIIFH